MGLKILLANDDGINAPGIRALKTTLEAFYDVYVVAPAQERSTTSHTITLDRTVHYTQLSEKEYACSGFPADCVLMATNTVFSHLSFDLVISGINRGANLGQDVYYSGTVAAAREASLQSIPAFAVSLVLDQWQPGNSCYYQTAADVVLQLIDQGFYQLLGPYQLLNINVPNLPWTKIKGLGVAPLGLRCYQKAVTWSANEYSIASGGADETQRWNRLGCYDVDLIREEKVSCSVLNLFAQSADKLDQWQAIESKIFPGVVNQMVANGST